MVRLLPCLLPLALAAQTPCPPAPAWSPCDVTFELSAEEAAAHPNPFLTVDLEGEFRSPRYRTLRMPAFWDGGRRFVLRFTPTEPGQWVFRLSSNLPRLNDKEGQVTATEGESPGWLQPANIHHWAFRLENNRTPHLWMGDTVDAFPFMDRAAFDRLVAARAGQKFNHLRGLLLPAAAAGKTFPDPAVFQEIDQRILALNRKGIIADLVLARDAGQLAALFPDRAARLRWVRYAVARYAPMNVTWLALNSFENSENARALLKEMGQEIKRLDPYRHPRSTGAASTSSPLLPDEWTNYVTCQSSGDALGAIALGAIEHQLYAVPFINAGVSASDADTFRRQLWNAAMNGQYPAATLPPEPDSPQARQMTAWFDFFASTRHWELEPYFDVDGGRAVALEGVEYIVYVEKPGPVAVQVERHGYDVAWVNPITGERLKQKKGFKGDRFTAEPPDRDHDWVLHVSREGHKEGMLRSYKFDSRDPPLAMQEIEQNPQKAPFDIVAPTDTVSVSQPTKYAAKVTRDTRATRSMMWLWTGEVPADEQGFRVIGAGPEGAFHIPPNLARSYPAVLTVRLYSMNANGKVYSLIRVYKLSR